MGRGGREWQGGGAGPSQRGRAGRQTYGVQEYTGDTQAWRDSDKSEMPLKLRCSNEL